MHADRTAEVNVGQQRGVKAIHPTRGGKGHNKRGHLGTKRKVRCGRWKKQEENYKN